MPANFASDNVSGASPEIVAALTSAAAASAMPYGADDWTARVEAKCAEIFETEVAVFPVATGTAANALALAALTPPHGAIYCHPESHAYVDECGAPEFYSGGAKMETIDGAGAKIAADDLAARLAGARPHGVHNVRPVALTLSQATEAGTAYSAGEVATLCDIAHDNGMGVHMDGARFANAIVHQGLNPADATWRCGVDVLSFGATKNGALAAEAVIFFRREFAQEFGERRKRGGHLLSKLRFISAQLDAYLSDDLWRANARAANRAAARLADGLKTLDGAHLVHPVEANEVFAVLPEAVIAGLEGDGFGFYRMGGAGVVRLVASFNTSDADVDAFLAAARHHAEQQS
ncbi:MAG: beta-eliminating lyase-related protein [Alphaproteobacteria bacterium]|nr:beta-eliminating lyase-related protein [Alphaproteobacteria bacterium]